jgi:hypothetical protein
MVERDGSLGLVNRPVWFPSARGGNRSVPLVLQANTKPIPSCMSPHPRRSAIMDVMGLSSLVGRIRVTLRPVIWPGPSRPEPVPGVESEAEACAGPVMWGGPGP